MSVEAGSSSSSVIQTFPDNKFKRRRFLDHISSLSHSPLNVIHMLQSIPDMVKNIWSEKPLARFQAVIFFRDLLSVEGDDRNEEVIKAGVLPRFVEYLGKKFPHQLQLHAAWVITNLASGKTEHTNIVIQHGAVPFLVELVQESENEEVKKQALWALGNIAVDSNAARDIVLMNGALVPLSGLNQHSNLILLREASWVIANLSRGVPPPNFVMIQPALPILQWLIDMNDEFVLAQACRALVYFSDGTNAHLQALIQIRVSERLVQLLLYPSRTVILPTLRIIGHIIENNYTEIEFVIDRGLLPILHQLLVHNDSWIKKYACWTISLITAGSTTQIQAVFQANIVPLLVRNLQDVDFQVKLEAGRSIGNATSQGTHEQIRFLVTQGCIKPLCDFLTHLDPQSVLVCLESLYNILVVGEADKKKGLNGGINIYAQMVDQCEGLSKIQNLPTWDHDNELCRFLKEVKRVFGLVIDRQKQRN